MKINGYEVDKKSFPGILLRLLIMLTFTVAGLRSTDAGLTFIGGLGLLSALIDLSAVLKEYRRRHDFREGVEVMEEKLEYLDKDRVNRCCPHCGRILEIEKDNLFCPDCGEILYIEE